MYNFQMSKKQKDEILENVIFSKEEKEVFEKLTMGTKRNELPLIIGVSQRTISRMVQKIIEKINCYENNESISYKVYMHKFPNGKKYVGVCRCCEDRWANGNGYAYNKKMYDDIQKYGWDNIQHKVLYETTNSIVAYNIEKILIDELELVKNGYNNM